MLTITPQMRIFVALEIVDFRRGIDGLAAICREQLGEDPFTGALFVFRSRSRKAIKLLMYDGQGFWLAMKRLSRGRFKWWPDSGKADALHMQFAAEALQVLLWNGNPEEKGMAAPWRRVIPSGLAQTEKNERHSHF